MEKKDSIIVQEVRNGFLVIDSDNKVNIANCLDEAVELVKDCFLSKAEEVEGDAVEAESLGVQN
jgi:hypothetical protein